MIANGDRVLLTYWPEQEGIVVRAGEEVSEVKFPDSYSPQHYNNEHLKKISGSPVAYTPPTATSNPKSSSVVAPRRTKMPNEWKATDLRISFKPGTLYYVQATLARSTLNMKAFVAGGGRLNYLSWLFRKGYIR
jgi:hypothetical protein